MTGTPLAEKRVGGRGKKATETGTKLEPVSVATPGKNAAPKLGEASDARIDKRWCQLGTSVGPQTLRQIGGVTVWRST